MPELTPLGARVFVEEIQAIDDISQRAKAAGIYAVTLDANKPRPTSGKVVAVGTDPIVQDQVKVGDTIIFAKYSGSYIQVEGVQYRCLDLAEIIAITHPDQAG